MTRAIIDRCGSQGERGIALIVGLVILAVLSLIGIAAFSITTQEERMAGNSRDRMRAFEAAEAALRDCEAFVAGGTAPFDGTGGTYLVTPNASTTPSITESTPARSESWWQTGGHVRQLLHSHGNPFNRHAQAAARICGKVCGVHPGT